MWSFTRWKHSNEPWRQRWYWCIFLLLLCERNHLFLQTRTASVLPKSNMVNKAVAILMALNKTKCWNNINRECEVYTFICKSSLSWNRTYKWLCFQYEPCLHQQGEVSKLRKLSTYMKTPPTQSNKRVYIMYYPATAVFRIKI